MTAQAEQLRGKVTSTRQKAEDAKSSLAADKSENAVLSSLTKLKDQGRIKGFHVSIPNFVSLINTRDVWEIWVLSMTNTTLRSPLPVAP